MHDYFPSGITRLLYSVHTMPSALTRRLNAWGKDTHNRGQLPTDLLQCVWGLTAPQVGWMLKHEVMEHSKGQLTLLNAPAHCFRNAQRENVVPHGGALPWQQPHGV